MYKYFWGKPVILALFAVALLPIVPLASRAQGFCHTTNTCIQNGEHLRFKVYYNVSALWVPAGEAIFTTRQKQLEGRQVFHIVGEGKTYKSYDWFFKVRDRYETFIDTATLMPYRFIRDVEEGNTRFNHFVTFDQKGNAYSNDRAFSVPACVQDVLSAIYYARNIDYDQYNPGDKIPFSMFLDDEVHQLYIRYAGKVKITTRYGTFNALKITPLLINGTIFKGGEDMVVYVSDDANHLPLRIDSPIVVGSIKVDLMGYSGLRHPLLSLIKKK